MTSPTQRRVFNKPIRVSPKEKRTYKNVVYDSIAEMKRANILDDLARFGEVKFWFRQVPFQLGPDTSWRCDFLVISALGGIHVEDVKQFETPASRRIKKLWKKYGPHDLLIIGLKGGLQVIPAAVRREEL